RRFFPCSPTTAILILFNEWCAEHVEHVIDKHAYGDADNARTYDYPKGLKSYAGSGVPDSLDGRANFRCFHRCSDLARRIAKCCDSCATMQLHSHRKRCVRYAEDICQRIRMTTSTRRLCRRHMRSEYRHAVVMMNGA